MTDDHRFQVKPLGSTIPKKRDEADDYQSPKASPSVQGEQAASSSMPDPSSDDDTLQNAQDMGMQVNETTEHPEELDIARDIDKGEQAFRES